MGWWGGGVGWVAYKNLVPAPVPLELILTGFDWVGFGTGHDNILGLTSQVRWEGHKELPETHAPSQYSALLSRMKSSGVEVEDLYRFVRGSSGPQVVSGEVWG